MSYKGALFAVLVAFAVLFALVFENPLFLADFNSPPPAARPGHVTVAAILPSYPNPPWPTTGLSYACSESGPGAIEFAASGPVDITVVSVTLSYGVANFTAAGAGCPIGTGTTVISIVALSAAAGPTGSQFSGYATAANGTKFRFSGTWS